MNNPTIGFIGLGAMGEPMVARLLTAGFRVVSYVNQSREAMERLLPRGLVEVANARELGQQADFVMCCVFDEPQNDQALRRTRRIGHHEARFYRPSDEHHFTGVLPNHGRGSFGKRDHSTRSTQWLGPGCY